VLTLSGILQDILLVMLSVLIWSTPITSTQLLGYTIAIGGLIQYKVGGRKIHAGFLKFTDAKSTTRRRSAASLGWSPWNTSSKRSSISIKNFVLAIGLCAGTTLFWISRSSVSSSYLLYTELNRHPIEVLVERSRKEFQQTLGKQSTTLSQTVKEYKRRNGMHPPPKFDVWYDFATSNNVVMIDEYDMINDMLRPLWGLPPAAIRESARNFLGYSNTGLSYFVGLFIRNRRVVPTEIKHFRDGHQFGDRVTMMMEKFVNHLPDMDLIFNGKDEPTIILPHDELHQLVQLAHNRKQPKVRTPSNSFTRPSDLSDEIQLHYGSDLYSIARMTAWNRLIASCPLDSPARLDHGTDLTSSFAYGPLGFIYNVTAFKEVCNQPSLPYHHGFFDQAATLITSPVFAPVFSVSKASIFNDIIFPTVYLYMDEGYDEQKDIAWAQKRDQLHWRGGTSTGFTTTEGWRRHHRQRFVKAVNNITDAVKVLRKEGDVWEEAYLEPRVARELFDVKISKISDLTTSEAEAEQVQELGVAPYEDRQMLWQWKFLLDIDGLGQSGRYYALLRSKSLVFKCSMIREWHDEWLRPWVHYVPLGLNGSDWFEAVRYFALDETGQALGESMANESRVWAHRVLRKVDMEVWMFRLLLEYVPTVPY
jgi:Glycosyl transferase family 90